MKVQGTQALSKPRVKAGLTFHPLCYRNCFGNIDKCRGSPKHSKVSVSMIKWIQIDKICGKVSNKFQSSMNWKKNYARIRPYIPPPIHMRKSSARVQYKQVMKSNSSGHMDNRHVNLYQSLVLLSKFEIKFCHPKLDELR